MFAVPYFSKIGSHVAPAFVDFHTPPDAAATNTIAGFDSTASMWLTRPDMFAGPMFRQRSAPKSICAGSTTALAPFARATGPCAREGRLVVATSSAAQVIARRDRRAPAANGSRWPNGVGVGMAGPGCGELEEVGRRGTRRAAPCPEIRPDGVRRCAEAIGHVA